MDRELLLEIGCEELPASWLVPLTRQLAEKITERLAEFRLPADPPIETFSTPRRLTARITRVVERQTDLEEVVTGPPGAVGFDAIGEPTAAAIGFARKQGVAVTALERLDTPRGVYLGYRRQQRGKSAVDVLPDVLAGVLRDLSFPKQMHWDAQLEDGRGELLFGRPIRWIVFLYGGRVVPFSILRTELAQSADVQEIRTGAITYGHRFLTTGGRAGRALKVRSFEEYRARLIENFVVLERNERRDRIARELDAKAQRLGARVSHHPDLLEEVPDLVEFPSVVAGHFAPEYLDLPAEVLTTTMIHHQHYFPLVDDAGRLKPAFLAVANTDPDNERTVARNAERVLTARLRDARFFWEQDRRILLDARVAKLDTVGFHPRLGTYRAKAERIEKLARWLAAEGLGVPQVADDAARAARLAKADLTTEMVREFTELQGRMGGVYARAEGLPERIWKPIYYQYLPIAVEADAPPTRADLGDAAPVWAAVALADKLDTLVGLFSAGERPTGSRDPFGLRRQAHGCFKILTDLPELTGCTSRTGLKALLDAATEPFLRFEHWDPVLLLQFFSFLTDRLRYVFEQRGFDIRNIRAVVQQRAFVRAPWQLRKMLEVLPEFTESREFQQLATAFKRVTNIARELSASDFEKAEHHGPDLASVLHEPAETALLDELNRRGPIIASVLESGEEYRRAFAEAAAFGPAVDRFFTDVLVMTEEPNLREARLRLVARLRDLILQLADISEIVPQTEL